LRAQVSDEANLLRHWTSKLRDLDERLSLIVAAPQATHHSLTPGFYHVVRETDEVGSVVVLTLAGPDGSFRDPGEWMIERLRSVNQWEKRVRDEQHEAKKRARIAEEKAKQEFHEEAVDEISGRLKALRNPGVNFGTSNWSPKVGAKKVKD
jgi:hypothetical protein